MGQCLLTELKEAVNNNNLPLFGKLRLEIRRVADSSDKYYTNVGMAGSDTVVLETEHNVITYRGEVAIPATNRVDNVGYVQWGMPTAQNGEPIAISNFYALTRLHFSHNTRLPDTRPLRYCPDFATFDHTLSTEIQQASTFDVETLNALTNLATLKNVNISGAVADLSVLNSLTNLLFYNWDGFSLATLAAKTPNLTTIEIPSVVVNFEDFGYFQSIANITCKSERDKTIENMVAIARANGRVTGTINILQASNVKFNGDYVSPGTLTWDATSITYNGVTINP